MQEFNDTSSYYSQSQQSMGAIKKMPMQNNKAIHKTSLQRILIIFLYYKLLAYLVIKTIKKQFEKIPVNCQIKQIIIIYCFAKKKSLISYQSNTKIQFQLMYSYSTYNEVDSLSTSLFIDLFLVLLIYCYIKYGVKRTTIYGVYRYQYQYLSSTTQNENSVTVIKKILETNQHTNFFIDRRSNKKFNFLSFCFQTRPSQIFITSQTQKIKNLIIL
eukprot:TRINITY_DN27022_c0_g1_i2.p1 TRINITY_DN27022_c0_g1~~TRINITY_DN27022_c0_g1_i2.p1  ORF type:complete len:215 (+),score=-27.46 TRINITY_DN27022_c0_g1_i2:531-1175(+)